MKMRLRRFKESGLRVFQAFIGELREDGSKTPPWEILNNELLSEPVAGAPEISARPLPGEGILNTKREAAVYLEGVLRPLDIKGIYEDSGLWSWLSLFYFDSVCPLINGKRRAVAVPHYVLDAAKWTRRYRHLLLTPYRVLQEIPTNNRIFLDVPLPIHGDLMEQTMGKLYLIRVPAIRDAIDSLYFDKESGRAKLGILPTKRPKPGDFRNRLPLRIKQLQMTYDVHSLSGPQLIEKLGSEFDAWKS